MEINSYNAVDSILIPHTSFNTATKKILQCFRAAATTSEPICLAIVGESRAGKTRVLEHVERMHQKVRLNDGMQIPILRVTTPAVPSIRGLAETILTALGDPMPGKGTVINMTNRIVALISALNTRMVMIDEFQHFYDKERHKVMHNVADWFKELVDRCKVALVVSGLTSCQCVLNLNEQLAGRFIAPIHMTRFDWRSDELREEFIAILAAFHSGLKQFDLPKLDSDEMAFRFYCASGGLIGYLAKILRQAIWNALDDGKLQITLEDLAIAYQESVYKDEMATDLLNPFDRGFIVQVNDELLKRVSLIGVAMPEEPQRRKSRRKKEEQSSEEALHA